MNLEDWLDEPYRESPMQKQRLKRARVRGNIISAMFSQRKKRADEHLRSFDEPEQPECAT